MNWVGYWKNMGCHHKALLCIQRINHTHSIHRLRGWLPLNACKAICIVVSTKWTGKENPNYTYGIFPAPKEGAWSYGTNL